MLKKTLAPNGFARISHTLSLVEGRYIFAGQKQSGRAGHGYLLAMVIVIAIGTGWWIFDQTPHASIVAYEPLRDRPFIEKLFQQDWYWLTTQQFDPALFDQWLEHKSPTADASTFGILDIKMAQLNHSDVGFIAYFMKSAYEGMILFIDVLPIHRSKRIGRQLLEFALNDLQKRGASIVRLITRPHNTDARRLYDRIGFIKYGETSEYLFYEKKFG